MPYYVPKECPPDKVGDIGDLCEREGLKEVPYTTSNPLSKRWNTERSEIAVIYDPDNTEVPLIVQTHGAMEVDDPYVLAFVKQLIGIIGASPDEVYDHPFNPGKRCGCLLALVKRLIGIKGVYLSKKRYDQLLFRKPHPRTLFEEEK